MYTKKGAAIRGRFTPEEPTRQKSRASREKKKYERGRRKKRGGEWKISRKGGALQMGCGG